VSLLATRRGDNRWLYANNEGKPNFLALFGLCAVVGQFVDHEMVQRAGRNRS